MQPSKVWRALAGLKAGWPLLVSPRLRALAGPWADIVPHPARGEDERAGQAAWRAALAAGVVAPLPEAAVFAQRHARYLRADRTDVWALCQRPDRWVVVDGPLPVPGQPYLALTAHFGAGAWAHAVFGRHHGRTRWLYAPPDEGGIPPPQRALMARRLRALEQVMRHPPLATGGAAAAMLAWWRQGGGLMALADAPPGRRRRIVVEPLDGWRLALPLGLFQLAAEARIPVYVYFCTLERDGRRRISIAAPRVSSQPPSLAQHFAERLGQALRRDPAAWHFWPALASFSPGP